MTRTCRLPGCDNPLIQGDAEHHYNFNRRKYCCRAHQNKAKKLRSATPPEETVLATVPLSSLRFDDIDPRAVRRDYQRVSKPDPGGYSLTGNAATQCAG